MSSTRIGSSVPTVPERIESPVPQGSASQPQDTAQRGCVPIRMLRLSQVMDVTGLRKTKIYELQKQGQFPNRVAITANRVAWVEEDIQAWLAERVRRSRSASSPPPLQP
jgi:predicted DNA-binding transcriptional regulator AlpA